MTDPRLFILCERCGGSGFTGPETGYDGVCPECGGQKFLPYEVNAENAEAEARRVWHRIADGGMGDAVAHIRNVIQFYREKARGGTEMITYRRDAQWFESLGKCSCGCGKSATGILRGHRNDPLGHYTEACANKAIKAAHKRGNVMPDYLTEGRDR